jgi:hypothetical protein
MGSACRGECIAWWHESSPEVEVEELWDGVAVFKSKNAPPVRQERIALEMIFLIVMQRKTRPGKGLVSLSLTHAISVVEEGQSVIDGGIDANLFSKRARPHVVTCGRAWCKFVQ